MKCCNKVFQENIHLAQYFKSKENQKIFLAFEYLYDHILSSGKKIFIRYIFLIESCTVQVSWLVPIFFLNDRVHTHFLKKQNVVGIHKKNIQAKLIPERN